MRCGQQGCKTRYFNQSTFEKQVFFRTYKKQPTLLHFTLHGKVGTICVRFFTFDKDILWHSTIL